MTSRLSRFFNYAARTNRLAWLLVLLGVVCTVMPTPSRATSTGCFKITGLTTSTTSPYYTDPGTVTSNWVGSTDTAGQGAYPMTVQLNVPPFVPDGTLLGSAISPIYNLGANGVGSYSPEMVLFRCSPDSAGQLYEYFSTNGDNAFAGMWDVSAQSGIPGTYMTWAAGGLISRITNLTTGQYVTRYYQAIALTNLNVDSQGWLLVKAKNFSAYKLELFQCSACTIPGGGTGGMAAGVWTDTQPLAYVAFKGPNISNGLFVGADASIQYNGWYGYWPGAINAYNTVIVRRTSTCAVINATPVINFGTMTAAELNQGGSRQLPITIQMQCQTTAPSGMGAFASGINANQTALGLLVPPANAQSAISAGLTTTGSGVTYLLSNGYGSDPSVATGVGVALSRPGGTLLNFLTNQYVTTGGAKDGWDAVANDATVGSPSSGLTTYTRTINATFKAFAPGSVPVTPGSFNATAQLIVQVQ